MTLTPDAVTLQEITADTVIAVVQLAVADAQRSFVAPNAVSLAQALFAPQAWFRAIHCGEALVGFVMLDDESLRSPPPEAPEVAIWRLMIDARFQGRGLGRAAVARIVEHVRAKGLFTRLLVSSVPGTGSPEGFYRALGFRPTGKVEDGEVLLELPLDDAHAGTGGPAPAGRRRGKGRRRKPGTSAPER